MSIDLYYKPQIGKVYIVNEEIKLLVSWVGPCMNLYVCGP